MFAAHRVIPETDWRPVRHPRRTTQFMWQARTIPLKFSWHSIDPSIDARPRRFCVAASYVNAVVIHKWFEFRKFYDEIRICFASIFDTATRWAVNACICVWVLCVNGMGCDPIKKYSTISMWNPLGDETCGSRWRRNRTKSSGKRRTKDTRSKYSQETTFAKMKKMKNM